MFFGFNVTLRWFCFAERKEGFSSRKFWNKLQYHHGRILKRYTIYMKRSPLCHNGIYSTVSEVDTVGAGPTVRLREVSGLWRVFSNDWKMAENNTMCLSYRGVWELTVFSSYRRSVWESLDRGRGVQSRFSNTDRQSLVNEIFTLWPTR